MFVAAAALDSASRAACTEMLEGRTLLSTYFVSTQGSDWGNGSFGAPFKTIQEAANTAQWGDTVDIEGGTYHETVTPAHSGVTFTNYNGQSVTISGADPVGGWSYDGGALYQASMPWDLGEGNNQVFVDGQMVSEARWPNNSPDILHAQQATVAGYSNGILYDPAITQGNGYWSGASITITPGDGWVSYTGQVTNSGQGWLQLSLPSLDGAQPTAGNNYTLSGTFNALTGTGQWYRANNGTLYLSDPYGDNPNWHDIEVKDRQLGFNLDGVSNTTIQGINLFACTIQTNWYSSGTVINGITASYITQYDNAWASGWSPAGPYGIELEGANSTIENSTIGYSAGDGVFVDANNVTVQNNIIHDVDWSGTDAAAVRVYGSNNLIQNNTIYNTGRDGINIQGSPITVTGNVVHDFMLLDADGGGIYTVHNNGQGSTIAYNTIYNAHKNNYDGIDATGIMLDNDSSNWVVAYNVTANVDAGFKANNTSYNEQIYGNQFGGIQHATETNGWTGFAFDWSGSNVHDNVFYNSSVILGANVGNWNNSFAWGSPPIGWSPTAPPAPTPAAPPAASTPTVTPTPTPTPPPPPAARAPSSPPSHGSPTSPASPVPGAAPTPPSGGSNSTSTGTQQGKSVPATVVFAGPRVPQKKTHTTASKPSTGSSSSTSTTTPLPQIAGTVDGHFTAKPKTAKSPVIYAFAASTTLSGFGAVKVTGTGIGIIKKGNATGTIRIANGKGIVTLTISASATATSPTPTNFAYTVSQATGAYRKLTATGTLNLTFASTNEKGSAGTFALVL